MNGKKRILLTGATGYIGSELLKELMINEQYEVAVVVRDSNKKQEFLDKNLVVVVYSAHDLEQFEFNIRQFNPNIVIHLAAYSTSADDSTAITQLIESNIIFTSHLLVALIHCNVKLFINTGSFSEYHFSREYRSPTYFYSATKSSAHYMIEYFAKKDNFLYINAILYTVYGKKGKTKKIIDYALESLNAIEPIAMSDGFQKFDFIHIKDVVHFYIKVIENFQNFRTSQIDYDVGTGQCISIREMVKILELITDKKANIKWGIYKNRSVDTLEACAQITLTKKELDYETTISLEDGLKQYLLEREKL